MSPNPAAIAQANYVTGIKQMIEDPKHSKYRYIWDQKVVLASNDQIYRECKRAVGNSDSDTNRFATVKIPPWARPSYDLHVTLPGIVGVRNPPMEEAEEA